MKDQIKMIVFVFLLGIVAAAILVGSDTYTKPIIEEYQEYSFKKTILTSFEIEHTEDNVLDVYEEVIVAEEVDSMTFYYTESGNVGFEFEGKGLWGPIEGFMTLEPDYSTIQGVQITYNEETPGLGGVIAEQWYLNKYKGKSFSPEILIKKDADMTLDNEVDAITGATGTSNAFELILNETYKARKEVLN